jgi:hypothetical protein
MIFGLNAVDLVLIVLAIVVGYTGWVHGFVVGLLSFAGFVGGAIAGLLLVPLLLGGFEPGLGVSILAALLVLAVASIGQGLLAWAGGWVRSKVSAWCSPGRSQGPMRRFPSHSLFPPRTNPSSNPRMCGNPKRRQNARTAPVNPHDGAGAPS